MRLVAIAAAALVVVAGPARADWSAANADVVAAAKDARIAGALETVDIIDQALVANDQATFAVHLAPDLAVNNPQNGVSVRGATARRGTAGQIRYARYHRIIEYAGLRDDLVLLMGEEVVVPRGQNGEVHRRFTDLWLQRDGRWLLTARQATIIAR